MNGPIKLAIMIVIQAGVAFALAVFVAGPIMRDEPLPWQKEVDPDAEVEEEVAALGLFTKVVGIEPSPELAAICRQEGFSVIVAASTW